MGGVWSKQNKNASWKLSNCDQFWFLMWYRESRFIQFSHIDYWAVYLGLWVDLSHWGLFSCPNTMIFWKGHSALWKWSSPGKAGYPVLYLGTKGGPEGKHGPFPAQGCWRNFQVTGKCCVLCQEKKKSITGVFFQGKVYTLVSYPLYSVQKR